jgi:poly(A) polymerase
MPHSRRAPPRTAARPQPSLLPPIAAALPTPAWCVGGYLRDRLLGRPQHDLDLLVAGDPAVAARSIAERLGGHAFPLDAERGQWRVVLASAAVDCVDLTGLAGDLAADLARRDFSVNAIAAPLAPDGTLGAYVDPVGGQADIAGRLIRIAGPDSLRDDPLRLLRAVRLATELGFTIDAATAAAIRAGVASLDRTAPERQRDELLRILATDRAAEGLRLLDELGLLDALLPEVTATRGVEQPKRHHYWDVFNHSLETVAALDSMLAAAPPPAHPRAWLGELLHAGLAAFPLDAYLAAPLGGSSRAVLLKLAGLLHDVGKPASRGEDETGRLRFFGHSELGAAMAGAACRRLRFGRAETQFVAHLIEEHLRPTQLSQRGPPSRRAVYRFFRDLGEAAPACLLLTLADGAAAAGPRLTQERWRGHVSYISNVLAASAGEEARTPVPRLITGDDLISELGLRPGPLLGRVLGAVEEAVGAGEVASRDQALALARDLAGGSTDCGGTRVP